MMINNASKAVFAGLLSAAVLAVSGCGGTTEVNAETLASATAPASETTTAFSTTTTTAAAAPEVQPDSSVFPFKPGVWLDRSGLWLNNGRETSGIYFIFEIYPDNERVCWTLGLDTGAGLLFDGERDGEDVVLSFASSDDSTRVRFTVINENTVDMTFLDDNTTERLTFVTDDTGNFTFYPEEFLIDLAKQYYAERHDGHVPTKAVASSEDDNTVLIQLYDDESYSLNATSAWYFIDRFTGKGKDIDGREIDLTGALKTLNSSSSPITGVWWLKDKEYGGEIWVIQDNKAGYVTELINGMGYDFTYEIDGSAVVFSYHGTTAKGSETFTLGDGEIIIDQSRKLTRITDKTDGFVVYSNVDLANKAAEYYASTHDGHFPAKAVWSIEPDDRVLIRLLNDESRSSDALNDWYFLIEDEKEESGWTYTEIARYIVDRFDGKGVDGDGVNVDISYTATVPEKWSPTVAQRQVMSYSGEVFGVRYLGYIDPSITGLNDTVRRKLELTGTASEFPFVTEMPDDRFVSSGNGQELYLIIPADPAGHVKVCPQAAPDEYGTDLVTLLYDSPDGEPFLLKCNASEIYSDVKVIFADSTGEIGITEWYPQISGGNGRVVTANNTNVKVRDFTDYENLAGAYPASNNTYGG